MTDTLATTFWDRIDDVRAGMLEAPGAPPRPMAQTARPDEATLWFITAEGTDIVEAAQTESDATFTAACAHSKLYATVNGKLSIETEKEKLDEIWSPMASVWFEDGREDDSIRLVRMRLTDGEVWATDGTAKSLFEMAKAGLSEKAPALGDHGLVRF